MGVLKRQRQITEIEMVVVVGGLSKQLCGGLEGRMEA